MRTRLYNIADYKNLHSWWGGRWGDAPNINVLPQSGLIVEHENNDIAAGWIYLDMTTPTALLTWMLTNPKNTPHASSNGLECVIEGLKELAKSQGRTNILASCPSGALSRLFQRCGFKTQDSKMEHLTLIIN